MPSLGMKLDAMPTERVVELAREVDRQGLDELWICEDLGRNGGIAQAALALAVTERCKVGLGIVPAAVRNVAYLAMEIASLCRAHPDRFLPGLGHGMPDWLRQVGAHPDSLLACLEEVTVVNRRLLAGETVTFHGRYVDVGDVALEYPPATVPPLWWGVRGPKSIDLASRVADGLILAEGSGPGYVRRSRERVGGEGPTIVVFTWFSIDADADLAVERMRPQVSDALGQDYLRSQLGELASGGGPDDAIRELTVSGDAGACAAAISRLYEAGADSVVLQPIPGRERDQLDQMPSLIAALAQ